MGASEAGTHSNTCGSSHPVFKPRKQTMADILYNIYLRNGIDQTARPTNVI
jgi:hypothetical protein